MSIVTITTMAMFIVCSFISMMYGVLEYWELLIPMLYTLPAYSFCKHKQKPICVFFALMTVSQVLRLSILPFFAQKGYICVPISIADVETAKIIGFLTIVTIIIYFALLYAMCYSTIKDLIKKSKNYGQLTHSVGIQNTINMFNASAVITILVLLMSIFGYHLEGQWGNIAIFIFTLVIVALAFQVQVINDIRERKEQFIEELRDKDEKNDDLILIGEENGSGESKE